MKWILFALAACPPLVASPIQVERNVALDFGTLVARAAPGGAVLEPRGALRCRGGLEAGPGFPRPGLLALRGPAGAPFTVTFGAPPQLRKDETILRLAAFEAWAPAGPLVFDGAGHALLQVGATLEALGGGLSGPLPATSVWVTVATPNEDPLCVPLDLKGRFMAALRASVESILDFGMIVAPQKDAAVRMDPSGRLEAVGPVNLGGGGSAARFRVQGEVDAPFSVALPTRVLLRGPGEALELVDFVADPPKGQRVLAGGRAQVGVGATLRVPGGQKPGTYAGSFEVSFAYE